MTHKFWCHLALWWVKKETLHFVLSFGKIALSKLLQNVESPFRGAAPLKAHIAPQDPGTGTEKPLRVYGAHWNDAYLEFWTFVQVRSRSNIESNEAFIHLRDQDTVMQENMWARLCESHVCSMAWFTQPCPHVFLQICRAFYSVPSMSCQPD